MNTSGVRPPESTEDPPQKVEFDVEREVRFAVVMYGGVSLAIYINGVAQELLNLVRATAPAAVGSNEPLLGPGDKELAGSAGVYRKLGQRLVDGERDLTWSGKSKQADPPIRTRFIVDVISGTSAGGINGVFLAKALARNQKMDGLKNLWLSEGDLSKLLNDSLSVEDLRESGFTVQEPQRSLLNSQRMYRKLLEALAQMAPDGSSPTSVYASPPEVTPSPLVDELDLFITTTDIEGVPLPIVLSDRVVFERRYKNVFHFRYAKGREAADPRDDFRATNDPFLAFAARCTSSFPFAFEPMRLQDIMDVVEGYARYRGATLEKNANEWDCFFAEYLRNSLFDLDKEARGGNPNGTIPSGADGAGLLAEAKNELRKAFQSRSFGDGGYLDNKPFSYATATLMRRQADYTVKRKLIYVEPSPEHPELLPSSRRVPDFAENVRAAVLDLPGRETIREDIDKLFERNQMVQRVATFAREIDDDVNFFPIPAIRHRKYCAADVGQMIKRYGLGYGAYHRLKVAEITSTLAELVTRAKEHDPASDAGTAIRELVAAWRRDKYKAMKPLGTRANKKRQQTENQFLVDFDLRHRLRRVIFLMRRLNELLQLDPTRDVRIDPRIKRLLSASLRNMSAKGFHVNRPVVRQVQSWLKSSQKAEIPPSDEVRIWLRCFCRELKRIKRVHLSPSLGRVRTTEENLLDRSPDRKGDNQGGKSLCENLDKLEIPWPEMKQILELEGKDRTTKADEILGKHSTEFEEVADSVIEYLKAEKPPSLRKTLAKDVPTDADRPDGPPFPDSTSDPAVQQKYCEQGELAARLCLIYCDDNFIRYDMVTYPVAYGTGAGEANKVEIFRVSPEDATALMNERGTNRSKLAGTALMSFGAFLDEGWRSNDMLWGRLDGAERIISALLPDKSDDITRKELIKEAHIAILNEEIKSGNIKTICDLVGSTLAGRAPRSEAQEKLRDFVVSKIAAKDLSQPLQAALYQCLDQPQKIWEYYGSPGFQVNRELDAEIALRLISRATNVAGRMFEGLAEDYRLAKVKAAGAWIAQLANIFWNIIGVAVPGSLRNLLLRHWLGLIYVFEFFLIFVGIFFSPEIKMFGWQALGVTLAFNLCVTMLGYYMTDKQRRLNLARTLLAVGLVALVASGVVHVTKAVHDLSRSHQLLLAAGVAIPLWIVLGRIEWRKWIGQWWAEQRRKSTAQSPQVPPAIPRSEEPPKV